MDYGTMIRNAREELGLYLKDLAQENLSFNLLSNIEKGKTKLTKQKALMLYKSILEHSWGKKVFPELSFDELLEESEEYMALKQTHEFCWSLKEKNSVISEEEYIKSKEVAAKKNIGMLTYFIHSEVVRLLPEEMSYEKLSTYHEILDFLRWSDISENIEKFKSNLLESIPYSYKHNKLETTIKYYTILLEAETKYNFRVDSKTYFNLAILTKREKQYNASLRYLNKYKNSTSYLSLADEAEVKIIKASLLANTGEVEKALDIYLSLSERLNGQGQEYLEASCYGNSIHRIFKHEVKSRIDLIPKYLEKLIEILETVETAESLNVSMYSMYSNIAQGYFLIDNYNTAKSYFVKALKCSSNDRNKLVILSEAIALYAKLDELEFIIDKMDKLELNSLNKDDKNLLYEMIIEILYMKNESELNIDSNKLNDIYKRGKEI